MTTKTSNYVPGLDGLRALAVNTVIIGHVGFGALVPGGLGVTTFFFISGYLITLLLWQEQERFGRIDMPRFYGRRTLRLLPELLAFLLVTGLVMGPLLSMPLPPMQAFAALFYWTNYFTIFDVGGACQSCAVTGHLWSLAVEEHFYLIMPAALVLASFLPRRMAILFVVVIVACLVWRSVAATILGWPEVYTYKATEARLDSIAWGCLAAVIQRSWPWAMAQIQKHAWAAFMAGAVLMLGSIGFRDETFRETLRYSVQGLGLLLMILPMITVARFGWMVRIMEWPVFRWMGRRSYGAYLWHMAAIVLVGLALGVVGPLEMADTRSQLIGLPLSLALTWLMAEASYRFVFLPSQRLKPLFTPRDHAAQASRQPVQA